jgi:cyclopropane-fatty-acyl-phospholipid synthase
MKAAGYYDAHSEYQRRVIEAGEPVIREMIAAADFEPAGGTFTIADYGAGTGATSVGAVKTAVAALRERAPDIPVLAVHNDVPTSDFTQLFRNIAAPESYVNVPGGPVYPAAVAGSFFAQVLPDASVHAGMCSNAAHWLREQPRLPTPDGMYFSDATSDARAELAERAARDWHAFLAARAAELAPGGHMLVQGIGSADGHVSSARLLRVMWEVAVGLADDGLLDRETLDLYVFPVYCRTVEEVREPGLLDVVSCVVDEVSNPYWETLERDGDRRPYAQAYVEFVRAFAEPTMIANLFTPGAAGDPQQLSDTFFDRLRAATEADPEEGKYEAWIVRTLFRRCKQ